MKKIISVILAVLMLGMTAAPVFADSGTHTVTFSTPSPYVSSIDWTDSASGITYPMQAYYYCRVETDGSYKYIPDEEGDSDLNMFVYASIDKVYTTQQNIVESYREENPAMYEIVTWNESQEVADGEVVSFRVYTNPVYNAATVVIFVNGELLKPSADGVYSVFADRDLYIELQEFIGNDPWDEEVLLRNNFTVTMTSGDGYTVKTLKDENYRLAYYGDGFDFRVKIKSGYTDSNMKVVVLRGSNMLSEVIGDDIDAVFALIADNEEFKDIVTAESLTSTGKDSDGYKTYHIDNITTDCKIIVSGVNEESKSNLLYILKRILRFILNALGLGDQFGGLLGMETSYTVTVNGAEAVGRGYTYEILTGVSSTKQTDGTVSVMEGEGITLKVTAPSESMADALRVKWNPGNEYGYDYSVSWTPTLDTSTGEVYYCAIYSIDNIQADTTITLAP